MIVKSSYHSVEYIYMKKLDSKFQEEAKAGAFELANLSVMYVQVGIEAASKQVLWLLRIVVCLV